MSTPQMHLLQILTILGAFAATFLHKSYFGPISPLLFFGWAEPIVYICIRPPAYSTNWFTSICGSRHNVLVTFPQCFCMFPQCYCNVSPMFPQCSHNISNVPAMLPQFYLNVPNVPRRFPQCSRNVTAYSRNVPAMYPVHGPIHSQCYNIVP